jgi:hypothetical protein
MSIKKVFMTHFFLDIPISVLSNRQKRDWSYQMLEGIAIIKGDVTP